MNDNAVLESIIRILSENVEIEVDKGVQPSDNLRNHGIDSVALMALTVYIENEFDISMDEIYEFEMDNITFKDLIELVNKELEVKK
jgi:acyl carrier protein